MYSLVRDEERWLVVMVERETHGRFSTENTQRAGGLYFTLPLHFYIKGKVPVQH